MVFLNDELAAQPLNEGQTRKILAYDSNLMLAELLFAKGTIGPLHQHPHEQIGYIISGKILYREEGKQPQILTAGDSYYVPPNVVHGIDVLEDAKLLDFFTPMREDFI